MEFRAAAAPAETVAGVITRITPAGSRRVELSPLPHLGGGEVTVDPQTGEASEPYFELTIDLQVDETGAFRHGMTGRVRLGAAPEPVATTVYRRLARFVSRLMQE